MRFYLDRAHWVQMAALNVSEARFRQDCGSRSKPLDIPASTRRTHVLQAVMEAGRAAVPELDQLRLNTEASPGRWTGNFFRLVCILLQGKVQL